GLPSTLESANPAASEFDVAYRNELDRRSWIEWGDSARARTFLKLDKPPAAGSVSEYTVPSKPYGRDRKVWVSTPPGYRAVRDSGCSLVCVFDAREYIQDFRLAAMLDSLTAAKAISPSVALLIDDASGAERLADLGNQPKFVTFVCDELMPWLRSKWRVTHDPARTIVTGSSAGGLASAYLAFQRPELFGNVLSQSGAFWRGNRGSNDAPCERAASGDPARADRPLPL